MSEAAKKALEALEAGAPKMTEAQLAYITGYADGSADKDAEKPEEETKEEK